MHLQGQDLNSPAILDLRDNWKSPTFFTYQRWIKIYYKTGDICPKRAIGNKFSQSEILGEKLEKLALYRAVFPKATQAECRAYLFNLDPTIDPISDSQLHRAEKLLDLTRKAASTTANQAYTPVNMTKRDLYWPPSLHHLGYTVSLQGT